MNFSSHFDKFNLNKSGFLETNLLHPNDSSFSIQNDSFPLQKRNIMVNKQSSLKVFKPHHFKANLPQGY